MSSPTWCDINSHLKKMTVHLHPSRTRAGRMGVYSDKSEKYSVLFSSWMHHWKTKQSSILKWNIAILPKKRKRGKKNPNHLGEGNTGQTHRLTKSSIFPVPLEGNLIPALSDQMTNLEIWSSHLWKKQQFLQSQEEILLILRNLLQCGVWKATARGKSIPSVSKQRTGNRKGPWTLIICLSIQGKCLKKIFHYINERGGGEWIHHTTGSRPEILNIASTTVNLVFTSTQSHAFFYTIKRSHFGVITLKEIKSAKATAALSLDDLLWEASTFPLSRRMQGHKGRKAVPSDAIQGRKR